MSGRYHQNQAKSCLLIECIKSGSLVRFVVMLLAGKLKQPGSARPEACNFRPNSDYQF